MKSLKDALMKAGVVSKNTVEREKEKERRDKIQKKGPSQEGIHSHHLRTDCDHCRKNSPDVEYYEHTNRSVTAKWLCIPCADNAWINDECRQTAQSTQSRMGTFRRNFGATKRMAPQSKSEVQAKPAPNPANRQVPGKMPFNKKK